MLSAVSVTSLLLLSSSLHMTSRSASIMSQPECSLFEQNLKKKRKKVKHTVWTATDCGYLQMSDGEAHHGQAETR